MDGFIEYVKDQLAALDDIRVRPMFGGHGMYSGDVFFAVIDEGRLYFKIDNESRAEYEERGMGPFTPAPDMVLKSYYEVPVDVLEDDDDLCRWARRAMQAQARTGNPKKRRAPK